MNINETIKIQELKDNEDVLLLERGDLVETQDMGIMRCHTPTEHIESIGYHNDKMLFIGLSKNRDIRFITINYQNIQLNEGRISFIKPYELEDASEKDRPDLYRDIRNMLKEDGIIK